MTPPRRPEDVTDEEVERVLVALREVGPPLQDARGVTMWRSDIRAAIAAGLIVPPPRERTQMEKDEEEWCLMRRREGTFSKQDAVNMSFILSRLFRAATAAGVTY